MDPLKLPSFLGEPDRIQLTAALRAIGRAISNRKADFLIGAGMSREIGLPSGTELATTLLRDNILGPSVTVEEMKEITSSFPFECLVEAVETSHNKKRAGLTSELRRLFRSGMKGSKAHDALNTLTCWHGDTSPSIPRIFTTNFDTLIEDTIGDRAATVQHSNQLDLRKLQDDRRLPVIHLHGTLKSDDDYVITETDVFRDRFDALATELNTALSAADTFAFVGYSMADPDFRDVYLKFRKEIRLRLRPDVRTFVVAPAASAKLYTVGRVIWDARGVTWIPMAATDFFSGLLAVMDSDVSDSLKTKVKAAYGLTTDGQLDDLVAPVRKIFSYSEKEALILLADKSPLAGR